jgi:hypothetical protein
VGVAFTRESLDGDCHGAFPDCQVSGKAKSHGDGTEGNDAVGRVRLGTRNISAIEPPPRPDNPAPVRHNVGQQCAQDVLG